MDTEDAKLHFLLIGRDASLAEEIEAIAPDVLSATRTERPGLAVRRFEADSPDAVIIEIGDRAEQAELLLKAVRDRPLGALVPVFLVDRGQAPAGAPLATQAGASEAGSDRFFPEQTPAGAIVRVAAEILSVELDLDLPEPPEPEEEEPDGDGLDEPGEAQADREFSAEGRTKPDVEEEATGFPPERRTSTSAPLMQSSRADSGFYESGVYGDEFRRRRTERRRDAEPQGVTAETIRRKLKQARHEDYFALLEIRKSADADEVEQAYRSLRRRFDPEKLSPAVSDQHFHDLRELCDAIDDAFGVLGAEPLRSDYLRSILRSDAR